MAQQKIATVIFFFFASPIDWNYNNQVSILQDLGRMIYGHEYGRQRRCPSVQVIAYNFLRHNSNMEPSLVCIFKVDLSFQNMKMGAMQLKRSFLTPNLGTGAVSGHTI